MIAAGCHVKVIAEQMGHSDGGALILRKRWQHILAGHPELEPHLADVTRAVREPDRRMAGRQEDEEWFYLEGAGPSRWLKVVVHYEDGRGRVVTAFGRRSMP